MNVLNIVEINGVLYFMGSKPTGAILEDVINYDSRLANAKVLVCDRLSEVKHALTVRSAAACNYRLVEK